MTLPASATVSLLQSEMKPHKTSTFPAEVKILICRKIPSLYFKIRRDLLMQDRKCHLCHLVELRDILCPYLLSFTVFASRQTKPFIISPILKWSRFVQFDFNRLLFVYTAFKT